MIMIRLLLCTLRTTEENNLHASSKVDEHELVSTILLASLRSDSDFSLETKNRGQNNGYHSSQI